MFNILGWERLQTRNDYFTALMIYKSLNGLAPNYLANMFKYLSTTHSVNTRQAAAGHLALPPATNGSDIELFKSSFSYSGVQYKSETQVLCNLSKSNSNDHILIIFKHI